MNTVLHSNRVDFFFLTLHAHLFWPTMNRNGDFSCSISKQSIKPSQAVSVNPIELLWILRRIKKTLELPIISILPCLDASEAKSSSCSTLMTPFSDHQWVQSMKTSFLYTCLRCNVIKADSNPSGATGGNVCFQIQRALGLLMHKDAMSTILTLN